METINIELKDRSYNIYIGTNILSNESLLAKFTANKNVAIITNSTVGPLYCNKLVSSLKEAKKIITITLKDGEEFKTQESLNQIYTKLLQEKFGRDSIMIALGGGVIGDITGFAASSFMRGIDFLQAPTTLLSQVDSSVGGKTGINHPLGKNMIGSFYQPKQVLIDISCLNTLPDNELSAGLAEVIKYGIIRDSSFFKWLELNIDSLTKKNPANLSEAIMVSCKNKAVVVSEDELESEKGIRATLNLGHTFGHAIETAVGYGNWLHGEAVSVGIVMASFMSFKMGLISNEDFNRIKALLLRAKLPINPPDISKKLFLDLMLNDKKNKDGQINLILVKQIGKAFLTNNYPQEILEETIITKSFV